MNTHVGMHSHIEIGTKHTHNKKPCIAFYQVIHILEPFDIKCVLHAYSLAMFQTNLTKITVTSFRQTYMDILLGR